jgi:hypothetical protein
MPLPPHEERRPAAGILTKALFKRYKLDLNSIEDGAAVQFDSVFVSAPHHKKSYSLGAPDGAGSTRISRVALQAEEKRGDEWFQSVVSTSACPATYG